MRMLTLTSALLLGFAAHAEFKTSVAVDVRPGQTETVTRVNSLGEVQYKAEDGSFKPLTNVSAEQAQVIQSAEDCTTPDCHNQLLIQVWGDGGGYYGGGGYYHHHPIDPYPGGDYDGGGWHYHHWPHPPWDGGGWHGGGYGGGGWGGGWHHHHDWDGGGY